MIKTQAKEIVEELVERFDYHIDEYKKGSYNETQTRNDFINPFFESLGWDINNRQGLAESYREVIHEDKIKISGSTKAPDYCFTIYGQRKFFLEAKKPSIDIKDQIDPAYQLRRYGWSAKMPISIITDFEELSIYDCTTKPFPTDKASVSRIKYITYKDYIKEFDFIWDIFSKDMILKGGFDKYVASAKGKKGTAGVDEEFLKSLDSWRDLLARNIVNRNNFIGEDELNYSLQKIMDRIIFLRICEDRGVESEYQLQKIIGTNIYDKLKYIFHTADQKYNSGLFDYKKDTISDKLLIDDKVLKQIIEEMYYPKSPYEFSVIPVEIMGHSYEQYLGKVIRITPGHRIKIEEKPEVRKAGGVYYTPQYIVEYIVKNTVGKLVEGKTPEDVAKIKICDPACGSGSFLIGAYQYLLDWHWQYYQNNKRESSTHNTKDTSTPRFSMGETKSDKIISTPRFSVGSKYLTPEGNLTTSIKKQILLNNIYGVDIDTNAVEVTKLSLMLKALEGETEATINNQLTLLHERVLPTLDNNIKSGNSLIDVDFYDNQIDFEPGVEKKIKPFNWESNFPEVFKQGGFDAVIGNPPYVRQEGLDNKDYYLMKYNTYHKSADLFFLFLEKTTKISKLNGIIGMIVSNRFTKTNSGSTLRKFLSEKQIFSIIDFNGIPVFQDANVDTLIIILSNNRANENEILISNIKETNLNNTFNTYVQNNHFYIKSSFISNNEWSFNNNEINYIKEKIIKSGVAIKNLKNIKVNRGITTGLNDVFIINESKMRELVNQFQELQNIMKPILKGANIKRYATLNNSNYLIFTKKGIDISKYNNIFHYFNLYKNELTEVWESKNGSKLWFELRGCSYYDLFDNEKIIYTRLSNKNDFTLSTGGEFCIDSSGIINTDDNKYYLAILNSKVVLFYMKQVSVIWGKDGIKWFGNSFDSIPIKVIDFTNQAECLIHNLIVSLVDQMLKLNKDLQAATLPEQKDQLKARIDYTDKKIDKLVYELYGLTEEEIKIVEGRE